MLFDVETWKTALRDLFPGWRSRMERIGVLSPYAFLSAMTLYPLLQAFQRGDGTVTATLTTILAGLGSGMLASQLDKWKNEADAAFQIEQAIHTEPALRAELDVLLEKFNVFADASQILRDADRDWFVKALRDELSQLGNLPRFEEHVFRESYCSWLIDQVRDVPLAGVDPQSIAEETRRDLDLAAVYTALMTQTTKEEVRKGVSLGFDHEHERLSALAVLNQSPRLALLGDPGSGKSTFVNFVALCMAGELSGNAEANLVVLQTPVPDGKRDEEAQPQPWDHGPLLPVRVVLRDFVARSLAPLPHDQRVNGDTLWRFIVAELPEVLRDFADRFRAILLNQGGLLLLDGLDEVPEANERRVQVKTAVEQFAAVFRKVRVLVTSRTYAYQRQDWKLRRFSEAVLAPFGKAQIRRFVERWYALVGQARNLTDAEAQRRAAQLNDAIVGHPRLFELATRPLLLTLMASLHAWRGGILPEQREKLYAEAADLLLERWERQKGIDEPSLTEWLHTDREAIKRLLNELAFTAHHDQPISEDEVADIAQEKVVNGLMRLNANPDMRPGRLVEYLRDRAGVLVPRGVGVYAFPHRTFQEYFAACHLTEGEDFPENIANLLRAEPNRWREVTLLVGARATDPFRAWALADALCMGEPPAGQDEDESGYWGALLAAQILTESKIFERVTRLNQDKLERIRRWLTVTLRHGALPPRDRAEAGDALAEIGDPRFLPDAWYLPGEPLLGFVEIPAGSFLMGSNPEQDPDAYEDEGPYLYEKDAQPQHAVFLPRYYIARYPVTVAQFRVFVETEKLPEAKRADYLRRLAGQLANHPVVRVNWHDAVAYCHWLTRQLRENPPVQLASIVCQEEWEVMLPSEAEWEKAARGVNGRLYPWGDEFDEANANAIMAGIGRPSAVGCFPSGATPEGIHDLSGNVWEWTRSLWEDATGKEYGYPYDVTDGREDLSIFNKATRVLRGGAGLHYLRGTRCAARIGADPHGHGYYGGFRVVVLPKTLDSEALS